MLIGIASSTTREDGVDLGRGRQGRLRAEPGGREGAGGARAGSASSWSRPSSSETSRQAVNASPAAVPSTTSTSGGSARATSSPSSSRTAPSAPSVTATRPSRARERLELEAVHDREVRIDRRRAGPGGVEAEQAARLLPRGHDRLVGDLLLAEHRVRRGQLEAAERGRLRPARRRSSSRPPRRR